MRYLLICLVCLPFLACTYDTCERACQLHADYMLECDRVALCWANPGDLTNAYNCDADEYLAQCYEMWWSATETMGPGTLAEARDACGKWSWSGDCEDGAAQPMPVD